MYRDTRGFITDTYRLKLGNHDHPLPPAFAVSFDARSYAPSIFQSLGIRCPPEIQRAVIKRQAEYLAGRIAAHQAITHLGMKAAELGTGLLRQPLWPAGVIGSITHSDDMGAAIAIPSDAGRGIGIDIEHIIDTVTADAIRSIILTDEELAILVAQGDRNLNTLFTIAFSVKESFFKATSSHVGRHFEFHALRLTYIDIARGSLTLTVTETLSSVLRTGQTFDAYFRIIDERTVLTSFAW